MKQALMILLGISILIPTAVSFAGVCGDVNDDSIINILDIIYLIDYKFRGGPEPAIMESADVNSDGIINILDIIYLIEYKFKGGAEPYCHETGTMTDIDGNTYRTIKIGDQWWMAENLEVIHYRNGEAIPNVTDAVIWSSLTTGAYCEYNNDINNVDTCGRLYNWFAVNDGRNIAPEGWHVPTDAEWQTVIDYLGGIAVAGGKMKEKGTTHWNIPNSGATNESGFRALPGGLRTATWQNGYFAELGENAHFWSSSEEKSDVAWRRLLQYN